MKLLVCTSEYFPPGAGIANVVYNIVEQLKKQGVECTVCSPTGPDIRLGSKKLMEKCGIIGLIYYWYLVSKHIKKNDYDIFWFHSPLLIKKISIPNVIVTIHATYHGESSLDISPFNYVHLYKKVASIIEKYCLNNLDFCKKITVVSPTVLNELASLGFDVSDISVISNGVNTKNYVPPENKKMLREKFRIPQNNIVILDVGRLTVHKQPLELVELFSQVERKMNNVTLCIAGKGELFNNVQSLIKNKNLHNVLLFGYVSQEDLPSLYCCSDYYIMPSKYEGGRPPLTLAEAMASGLPCIVSDTPNLGVIKFADCGIIVNFKDVDRAAGEILEYITGNHHDHAKNARDYAINVFDWEIISRQYLKIFKTLSQESPERV